MTEEREDANSDERGEQGEEPGRRDEPGPVPTYGSWRLALERGVATQARCRGAQDGSPRVRP